jgi:pimeloyl-ACP methyl ester carboxylesterase
MDGLHPNDAGAQALADSIASSLRLLQAPTPPHQQEFTVANQPSTHRSDAAASPTQFLDVGDGRIAYDVIGDGPLLVLSAGMGDTRQSFRFLAPLLAAAGYRVARADLRGHGESSVGWPSYTRTDTAADLLELIRHLGEPAVIVGQSFSGGSATIAAATAPELVRAIVEIDPFTRPAKISPRALLTNAHHRRGGLLLTRTALSGSIKTWSRYLNVAYPGPKPPDWQTWLPALQKNLHEQGRMEAACAMGKNQPTDAAAHLPNVRCPALVVMGRLDPDWPDSEAEAKVIVDLLPEGLGSYTMVDGGHYPHAQYPEQVAAAATSFLHSHGIDPRHP